MVPQVSINKQINNTVTVDHKMIQDSLSAALTKFQYGSRLSTSASACGSCFGQHPSQKFGTTLHLDAVGWNRLDAIRCN